VNWHLSHRADVRAVPIADRHYGLIVSASYRNLYRCLNMSVAPVMPYADVSRAGRSASPSRWRNKRIAGWPMQPLIGGGTPVPRSTIGSWMSVGAERDVSL
jgi:hypothetical protein